MRSLLLALSFLHGLYRKRVNWDILMDDGLPDVFGLKFKCCSALVQIVRTSKLGLGADSLLIIKVNAA